MISESGRSSSSKLTSWKPKWFSFRNVAGSGECLAHGGRKIFFEETLNPEYEGSFLISGALRVGWRSISGSCCGRWSRTVSTGSISSLEAEFLFQINTCLYFKFYNRLRSIYSAVEDDIVASDVNFKLFAWNELLRSEESINFFTFVSEQGCAVAFSRNLNKTLIRLHLAEGNFRRGRRKSYNLRSRLTSVWLGFYLSDECTRLPKCSYFRILSVLFYYHKTFMDKTF